MGTSRATTEDVLVLRGATLVDGSGSAPKQDAVVVVQGERITSVGGRIPGGGTEIDLSGHTLIPGMIDAHAHLTLVDIGDPASVRSPIAVTAAKIFRVCELALQAGFTTVRDAGGADGGLASAVALGLIPGPRIYPSGPIIGQPAGHADYRDPFDHHRHGDLRGVPGLIQRSALANGPDEVRLAAREAFRHGATQLKVCVSGGIVSHNDRLEDAQLTVAELRAAVEEAGARDTYVLAHAHNTRGIRNGLEAGVQCFEHATFLDHATAQAVLEADAAIVPTLTVTRMLVENSEQWGLPPDVLSKVSGVEEAMTRSVKIAADAGIRLGSGSDLLGPEQNRRGRELVLKARVLGPMAALVAATRTNAEIMRIGDEVGTVTEGKFADLVAIAGDPISDPELFDRPEDIRLVMQRGAIVKDIRHQTRAA